jgi:hypothetical protein
MQSAGAAHPARMETRKARSTSIVPASARNPLIRVTLIRNLRLAAARRPTRELRDGRILLVGRRWTAVRLLTRSMAPDDLSLLMIPLWL